jgi:uncharacterized lipoprotein YddW (UPF0748 family)
VEAELPPAIYKQEGTKELSSVDPESTTFGGGRGANQLIAYTPAYGTHTGTNEWGSEAVIRKGIVISIGGNDSNIPQDGMIISGNSSASRWINHNLNIGMEVELHGKTLHYSTTENALVTRARSIFRKVSERLEQKKMTNQQLVEKTNQLLQDDFNALIKEKEQKNKEEAARIGTQMLEQAKKLYFSSFEPQDGEFKGVWIRLADKTPDELKVTIKKIADAGFNAILPETIYDGYAIYPGAHPLLPQLPRFKGWDPMQIMTEECRKYGIRVIPWCEMFFVGGAQSPLVKQKPEWIGKFRNGNNFAELEPGFHYFCPSRPEAKTFLLTVIDSLLERYPITEVQLDYIRYSLSQPWEKGFCYCDYCRRQVRKKLNFDIMAISPDDKKEWHEWNEYRINNITGFVKNVNNLLKKKHPGVEPSVDVVPNPAKSLKLKFQDWGSWVKNDQVDAVYIMSYALDNKIIKNDTKKLKQIVASTGVCPIVGLGPFLGFQPETLLEQIEVAREKGADGVCLFSFNALTPEQIEALELGPFRTSQPRRTDSSEK